ncbi:hypothetical protein BJ138DRAFT_1148335 [Hygrophoropsis aurantiaca]|uniref:Uncharacterized protein n=1 Tax=Hygrophoropsis aurantiaca TaxID=72124 RepID=A0ACB8AG60_9AGAM|nr:hypothetical protein BJ138DRAFT_1148335 [Hygrophoropsis aurantiaca]
MVFARLGAHEKEAFFELLDEYFQSRPELLGGHAEGSGSASGGISQRDAASAVHRAFASNPEATSRLVSAGLTHGVPKSSPYAAAASNPEIANSVGRVSAAALSFSGGNSNSNSTSSFNSRTAPPPVLPRRQSSTSSSQERNTTPGSEVDKLVAKKTSLFGSILKGPQPNMAPIPPAFPIPKGQFAPPPVRRVTSESSESAPIAAPVPTLPRRQVVPRIVEPEPEPEPEEPQGEWADVLYDYESEDPGDLEIKANQRVLITAKSSEDWWTGQIDGAGKEGLFPASYVQLL